MRHRWIGLLSLVCLGACASAGRVQPRPPCLRAPLSQEALRASPDLLRAEQKRQRVEALMVADGTAWVHLDSRRPEVVVPAKHRGQKHLVLEYGRGGTLAKPIVDLAVCPEGIYATLSFSSVNHRTFVPWTSVYAVANNKGEEGALWQEDMPPDATDPEDTPEQQAGRQQQPVAPRR